MKNDAFNEDFGPLDENGEPLLPNWGEARQSLKEKVGSLSPDAATLDYSRLLVTMPRLALESAEFLLSERESSERRQRLLMEMELAQYLSEIDAVARHGVVSAVNSGSVSVERLGGLLNSAGAIRGAYAAVTGQGDEVTGNEDELLLPSLDAAEAVGSGTGTLPTGVVQSSRELSLPETHTVGGGNRWQRIALYAIAPCLLLCLAVGYGGGHQVAQAAASQTISALNSRVSDLLASLEVVKKRPTMDPLQHAQKGREFSIRQGESPNEVVVRLSPFLGMPFYAGLDVDWGDGSALETFYFAGEKPEIEAQLTHEYMIDPGAQQLFEVVLTYYWSGETMASMSRSGRGGGQTVTETISLRVSDAGVLPVSGAAASIVSASITEPSEDDVLVNEAEPSIRMSLRPPGDYEPSTPAAGSDRAIHLVVRALDGPAEVKRYSYVQPITVSVSSLLQQQGEQQFDTWVSLPGSGLREPPTKYEILVIELPVALVQQEIDRMIMNLDDPTVRTEVVRSSRVIRYQAVSDDAF